MISIRQLLPVMTAALLLWPLTNSKGNRLASQVIGKQARASVVEECQNVAAKHKDCEISCRATLLNNELGYRQRGVAWLADRLSGPADHQRSDAARRDAAACLRVATDEAHGRWSTVWRTPSGTWTVDYAPFLSITLFPSDIHHVAP
jgi:hypothetical protein